MQILLLFSGILAVIAVFFKVGERVYLKSQQIKHSTVAQIAVMRKMVGVAFALFKNQTRWEPRVKGDRQGEALAA